MLKKTDEFYHEIIKLDDGTEAVYYPNCNYEIHIDGDYYPVFRVPIPKGQAYYECPHCHKRYTERVNWCLGCKARLIPWDIF